MDQYKKEITALFNKMTKEDQVDLHKKISEGDRTARDTIIQNCLPLVVKISEKYHHNNKHVDLDDLIQEGNIALINAVDNWDIERGTISTVVTWYVRNALNDLISDARYKVITPFTMSRTANEDLRKIKAVDSTDLEEVAKSLGMKKKRVSRLMRCNSQRVSFDFVKDVIEEQEQTPKRCITDVYELCENHLEGIDKQVFGLYIGVKGRRMKIRQICNNLNMIEQDVRSIINRSKTKLKRIAANA